MSTYIHFYVRSLHDDFVEIGEFSRNNKIYSVCGGDAPYEAIAALNANQIQEYCDRMDCNIRVCKDNIKQYRERMTVIASFNDPIDDKLEAISMLQSNCDEEQEEIEECYGAVGFLRTLLHIIEANRYSDSLINIDELIYYGVEISEPTVKDIQK